MSGTIRVQAGSQDALCRPARGWRDLWDAASGGLAVAVSLVLTLGVGVVLVPDTAWYLDGFALFPAPLSTAVGSFGVETFAALQAIAAGVLVWLIVRARPALWSVLWALPVLLWMVPLCVDVVAGALVVGVLLVRARSRPVAFGLYVLSAGYHLAAVVVAGLLALPRSRRSAVLVLLVLVVVALAVVAITPYSAGLVFDVDAFAGGLVVAIVALSLGLGPYVAGDVPLTGAVLGLSAGVFVVALYAGQWELHRGADFGLVVFAGTRYALPLVLWALVCPRMGESERPTTAPASGV